MGRSVLDAADALKLIEAKKLPRGVHVRGTLSLKGLTSFHLPENLQVSQLEISSTHLSQFPRGLRATRILANGCQNLHTLPDDLECDYFHANGSGLESVPSGVRVRFKLELRDCARLTSLPENFFVPSLDLRGCSSLRRLPEGLDVHFLDLAGSALEVWPERGTLRMGRLNIRGLAEIKRLPNWLGSIAQLDIAGCRDLAMLPENLHVTGWIDLAGTGLTGLPPGCRQAELRWRSVPVDERVAFQPESITAPEILSEANVERRRVLLERCGYERFMKEAGATLLDQDRDPGGPRRLLKVPLEGDEDLVCVCVLCPSTGRQYVLRVPPAMTTCRQAVAWVAGFDNPDDYEPVKET